MMGCHPPDFGVPFPVRCGESASELWSQAYILLVERCLRRKATEAAPDVHRQPGLSGGIRPKAMALRKVGQGSCSKTLCWC